MMTEPITVTYDDGTEKIIGYRNTDETELQWAQRVADEIDRQYEEMKAQFPGWDWL